MVSTNFEIFNEDMSSDRTFSDAEYGVATQRQGGVIPGMALSRLHNKLYRQATSMAKAIADFLVAQGYDCMDNDVPGITAAIQQLISAKASLTSPALTGTPTAPTAPAGTNTIQIASTAFVVAAIANLVASAPGALDTLKELADALGDDPNFATTMTNLIAQKLALSGGNLTGAINETSVTMASAGTMNIGAAAGNTINVSGTTNITAFDAVQPGTRRKLRFANGLTIVYNATNIVLPGATNLPVNTGDVLEFTSLGGGAWYLSSYAPATTLSMQNQKIVNLSAGVNPGDAVNIGQLTSLLPPGSVIYVAQSTAPSGYLKANGAAASRTTYANLFAAIGTIFGSGDGSTTFNLPDLRGEFIRGFDDSRGVDTTSLTGSTTNGSNQITGLSSTGFMVVGMSVTGSGVPAGATIASIVNSTTISISANATATATMVQLTFAGRLFGSWESDATKVLLDGYWGGTNPVNNRNYAVAAGSSQTVGPNALTSTQRSSCDTAMHTVYGSSPETRPRNVALLACIKY